MKGSTIFLVLLGLCIAAVGGVFTVLMWHSFRGAVEQRSWPQVEAVVLSSELEEWQHDEFSPREFRLKILYGYEWQGVAMTGERYGFRGNPFYNKRNKVAGLVEEFPVGKVVLVYVNPEDPGFTMIKADSKAPGYSIWFPLLFVVGGLGIAGRAVWRTLQTRGDKGLARW